MATGRGRSEERVSGNSTIATKCPACRCQELPLRNVPQTFARKIKPTVRRLSVQQNNYAAQPGGALSCCARNGAVEESR